MTIMKSVEQELAEQRRERMKNVMREEPAEEASEPAWMR